MANIPGTSGPVKYPNQPEGGVEGGPGYRPLPGGTNRVPETGVTDPGPQQGAGSGSGGLFPNPGESADGSVRTGWKGSSYAAAAPPNVEAVQGLAVAQTESGEPGTSNTPGLAGGLDAPRDFTPV